MIGGEATYQGRGEKAVIWAGAGGENTFNSHFIIEGVEVKELHSKLGKL